MSNSFDDIEDLAAPPSGGRAAKLLGGIWLAAMFIVCGVADLFIGRACIYGKQGAYEFTGGAATALSVAYIAMGAFMHFHWFWGLHEWLWSYSHPLKTIALLVFLPCFVFTLYRFLWT